MLRKGDARLSSILLPSETPLSLHPWPPENRKQRSDVNDDGYSDVIISAHGTDEAYVFYGAASFASDAYALSTLSGNDGFIISVGNDGDETVVAGAGVRGNGEKET